MTDAAAQSPKTNLFGLDRDGLAAYFQSIGEKPFRAQQVLKWIYHQRVTDFGQMTNLSKALRDKLSACAQVTPPELVREQVSTDGTRKWLIGFGGRNAVETVYIPEPKRGTLCVSSQVGCGLNCTFCSTGTQGFNRNLSTAEIIGQVWVAAEILNHDQKFDRQITNVVMMGMGEPLLNFENVIPAMRLMRDDLAFGLASKRVTLSTAGLVPGIRALNEAVDVALAISLHAPNDELRSQIVPLNKKYNIQILLDACKDYVSGKRKGHITVEYTMLKGVNDKPEHARQLVKVLSNISTKINLIPFNPFPGTDYQCSSRTAILRFQQILVDAGLVATIRRTRGQDIDAACGQLVGKVMDRTRRQAQFKAKLAAAGAVPS